MGFAIQWGRDVGIGEVMDGVGALQEKPCCGQVQGINKGNMKG